jgi:phosphonate transport system substrate-binding protein
MSLPSPLRFSVSRNHGGIDPVSGGYLFASALSSRLRHPVELKLADDYDELTEGLLAGKMHVAWMAPLAHARASQRGALLAAVTEREGALCYRSALLVRNDSVFTAIGGLRGVRAAWNDPTSASGYLYARLHLLHAGIDPRHDLASERFYGSSRAAAAAVLAGEADLCTHHVREGSGHDHARALGDVERMIPEVMGRLRVLDVTDPIPPDGVVLSDRLPPDGQARIRDGLLDLHQGTEGRHALGALMQADRLRGVTSDVLKIVARLRAHAHVP